MKAYVAVVCTNVDTSRREDGDYSCFLGTDKRLVIRRAMRARAKWESRGTYQYRILVGRLSEEADFGDIKLVPLGRK